MEKLRKKVYKLLRWSEKYTKTDMVYLTKGMSWLTLGQVVASGSSFFLAIAFANLLPPETYGTYKFVLSIAGILAIPTLQGMGTAVVRAVAQENDATIHPALKARLRWGTLSSLGGLIGAGYYYLNGNITLTISLLILALFVPLMESFNTYDALLQGKKKFGTSTKFFTVTRIASFLTLGIALLFTDNLFLILLAYFVPYTTTRYFFLRKSLNTYIENNNVDRSSIGYGKHLSLMGIIGSIANHLDKILLFHFLGPIEVAIYSFAIAIPEQIKGFLKFSYSLALPKMSMHHKDAWSSYQKNILQFFGLLVITTAIYFFTAPFIYQIFFPEYIEAIFFSQIFAISTVTFISFLPMAYLRAHAAKKILYFQEIFSYSIQIILLFIGVYFYGIIGVVIARILSRLTSTITSFYFANSYNKR